MTSNQTPDVLRQASTRRQGMQEQSASAGTAKGFQEYETFELLVGPRAGDGYPVTVIQSPGGEASGVCSLDPAADDLQAALNRIEFYDADERLLAAFGHRLFDALFPDPIARLFRAGLGMARGRGKGLRVRLHLESPQLAALPWEYLRDPQEECFLAISPETPLVRYVSMPSPIRPTVARLPLRVLVIIFSPSDAPPLEVAQERDTIEEALRARVDQGLVHVRLLEHGLVDGISQAMRDFRPHVFHFIGHGRFEGEEACVLLEDERGEAMPMDERTFREFFLGMPDTRLAVLNACQTATVSSARPLVGLAPRLLQRSLSAVIAMQYPIRERAALVFTREFYRSLALGHPVDAAIAEARKGIYLDGRGQASDWGIPVLFLRARDGQLFDLESLAEHIHPDLLQPEISRLPFEPETVLIPAGPFWMGSPPGEGVPQYETPQHEVDLPAYRIGKHPVTNAQYAEFIRQTGRLVPPEMGWLGQRPPEGAEDQPVRGVTWYEALAYARWLGEQTGRQYALPNEAQWERAARRGDLAGDVREWTCTLWGEKRRAPDPRYAYPWAEDGRNDLSANRLMRRVVRGGTAQDDPGRLSSARRGYAPDDPGPPGRRHSFRVVMAV
jgi:formylglycine-generating enzyme required for sulfatase activity